ncbi:MAG: hypothetical protein ACOYMA_12590 [Bacteroidia bacterium]
MKHLIEIDDELPNGKLVLQLLRELNINVKSKEQFTPLSSTDLIFGIGRPASDVEMFELVERIKKEKYTTLMDELLKEFE